MKTSRKPEPAADPARMGLAATIDVGCSALAAAAWYAGPGLGPWPLLLLATGRLARAWAGRRPAAVRAAFRPTPFALPLLLFLLSAGGSAWLAYDRTAAVAKFWVILAGIALCDSVAHARHPLSFGRWRLYPVRILLACLPAVIAVYFLLTNDWARWMGKLQSLDAVMAWMSSWQPQLPGHRLHPNVAGGLIAALIPLQFAMLAPGPAGSRDPQTPAGSPQPPSMWMAGVPLLGVSAVGLLLTTSRGAWLALAAATAAAAGGWWLIRALGKRPGPAGRAGCLGAGRSGALLRVSLVPIVMVGLAGGPLASALAAPVEAAASRLDLLHSSLSLALDYPFTGLGLAGFQMAYSSYVLLLHVGHTIHSHNLLLNVWIEQGAPGVIALAWLVFLAARMGWAARRRPASAFLTSRTAVGALVTLAVILLHGLVDDAFYGSRAVMLLFLPFGLLAGGGQPEAEGPAAASGSPAGSERYQSLAAASMAVTLALAGLLLPQARAAFQANLGALMQTQQELSRYSWPDWPIQDALRRAPEVDLGPAIGRYQAALALDPANVTANRRLGQIALSAGQYDRARSYLEAAYRADPGQRATRQLLGESYAVSGDVARAAELFATVDMRSGELDGREWWYDHVGEKQRAAWIKQAADQAHRAARK